MPASTPAAFVSYSREDADFALRLAQDLKSAGARIWLDQVDIGPGHQWDTTIEDALDQAADMLVILSPSSAKSRNVRDEISRALEKGKNIIPVLYKDCNVPLQLQRIQRIDFRADYANGLASLVAFLGVTPVESVAGVRTPEPPPAPKQAGPVPQPSPQFAPSTVTPPATIPAPAPNRDSPPPQERAPLPTVDIAQSSAKPRSFPWKPTLIGAGVLVLAGILLVGFLSSSHPATSSPAPITSGAAPSAEPPATTGARNETSFPEIQKMLDSWAASHIANDVAAESALYGTVISPFYGRVNASHEIVQQTFQDLYDKGIRHTIFSMEDVHISRRSEGHAMVTLTKVWSTRPSAEPRRTPLVLDLEKVGGEWLIVGEHERQPGAAN